MVLCWSLVVFRVLLIKSLATLTTADREEIKSSYCLHELENCSKIDRKTFKPGNRIVLLKTDLIASLFGQKNFSRCAILGACQQCMKGTDSRNTDEIRQDESRFLQNRYRVGDPDENSRPSSFLRRVYNGTLARASDLWLKNQLRAKFAKGRSSKSVTSLPKADRHIEISGSSNVTRQHRRTCCTVVWIFLGFTLTLAVGGGVMMIVMILSSMSDKKISQMCEQTPPRFGNQCEHRCHCANTSEQCTKNSGVCQSGCISGWKGSNCQIITSVIDKSDVNVLLPSNETFQCSINKLWYNWTMVHLVFFNDSTTIIMANVSQNGSTSSADQRLSASLSIGVGNIADSVIFAFNLTEYSCDLEGRYECQFEMEDNFTTQFANVSVAFSVPPSNLSVMVQSEYTDDATDDTVNCSGTIHLNTTTLQLVTVSNGTYQAAEQNSTMRLILESEMTNDCRHQVLVVYTGNFSSLDGRNVTCQAKDAVYGDNYFSPEETINVITTK